MGLLDRFPEGSWTLFDELKVDEAASSLLGLEDPPSMDRNPELYWQWDRVRRALTRALETEALEGTPETDQNGNILDYRIRKRHLAEWALFKDVCPAHLMRFCSGEAITEKINREEEAAERYGGILMIKGESASMPAETSDTRSATPAVAAPRPVEYPRLMELAIKAHAHFWVDWQPGTRPPRKTEVVAWLTPQGVTKNEAEAIDLIIKPPEAKNGGRVGRSSGED